MDFLIEEARLLDEDLLDEWLARLAPDIYYSMPVRRTVSRRDGRGFDAEMTWFYENLETLKLRVQKALHVESSFAEDPPSRIRRFVSNLLLHETDREDEYRAQSYLLLLRNRGNVPSYDTVSALREDLIRRCPAGWRLAQRTILIDQAALHTPNLAMFL